MPVHTHSQKLAQVAFTQVETRKRELTQNGFKDYLSFAKKFPALIHTCGLAQAVAFALAKKETDYIEDLSAVLNVTHSEVTNPKSLDDQARNQPLGGYLRLSRDAVNAAGWLKRYAEAFGEDQP